MRISWNNVKNISTHKYFRFDCKYWNTDASYCDYEYELLKDVFTIIKGSVQTENYVMDVTHTPYIRIGDIDYKFGIATNDDTIYLDDDAEINCDKRLKKDDLIFATIGSVGKVGLVGEKEINGTHSNNTVVLRPSDNINTVFYEKVFQTDWFCNYINGIAAQKEQPNLQQYDIENIRIPVVSKEKIDSSLNKISSVMKEIEKKKINLKSTKVIINSVFKHEFGLNDVEFSCIKQSKQKIIGCSCISDKNFNLRLSYRWNKSVEYQKYIQSHVDCSTYLGHHILKTQNGWSPTCNEDTSGYQVLGVDAILDNTNLSFDNPKFSSQYKTNFNEFLVRNGDFFVSRANTVDLVALAAIADFDEKEIVDTIYPDLMIRIEFDESVNKKYMAYLFNSFIGRSYFKYSTKGKNQTMVKVSADEINGFVVPLPNLSKQKRIVDAIQQEIDKQEKIKEEIAKLRNKIDDIIMKAISAVQE